MRRAIQALFLTYFCISGAIQAQTWMPDPAFGNEGQVVFDGFTGSDELMDLQVETDDGLLVLGWSTIFDVNVDLMVLARFTADGVLDMTFGEEGVATAALPGGSLVGRAFDRMPDGRIVVVGSVTEFPIQRDALLLRFQPDGLEDLDFGTFGRVVIDRGQNEVLMDVLVEEDGTILAAGRSNGDVFLMRIDPEGLPDAGFGVDGVLAVPEGTGSPTGTVRLKRRPEGGFMLLARIPDGFVLVAYDEEVLLDTTFGSGGVVFIPYAGATNAMVLTPEGDARVAGGGSVDSAGICLGPRIDAISATGEVDPGFGQEGVLLDGVSEVCDVFFDVALQADGNVIAAGTFTTDIKVGMDLAVLRYLADGTRDASFGDNGLIQVDGGCGGIEVAFALALQSDGRIIVGGVTNCLPFANDLFLVRLYPAITTGTGDIERIHSPYLVPNPTTGHSTLIVSDPLEGSYTVEVFDAMGRQAMPPQRIVAPGESGTGVPLDTKSLAAGTYAVVLTSGSTRSVIRFVQE